MAQPQSLVEVYAQSWGAWTRCVCGAEVRWAELVGGRRRPFKDDLAFKTGRERSSGKPTEFLDAADMHACG